MKKAVFFILLLSSLWGCYTIPAPDSEQDTLLIIPVQVSKKTSHDWFGKYRIDIARSSDYKTIKTILMPIKNGEIIRTNLEPGNYFIKRSVFVYDETHEESKKSIATHPNVKFTLEAGSITVLNQKFVYKIFDTDSDSYSMNRKFETVSIDEKYEILQKYKKYDAFALWKSDISDEIVSDNISVPTETESLVEKNLPETDEVAEAAENETDKIKPIVTVFDFEYEGVSEMEANFLVDFLGGALFDTGEYRIIDRTQREAILSEIQFSLSGCTDESCQLEAGKLLAADYMIIGSLGKVGSRFVINAKLIDIELGETVLSARDIYSDVDSMLDGCNDLAMKLSTVDNN